jgi:hypothetical protein
VKSDKLTVQGDEQAVQSTRLYAPEDGTIVSLSGQVGEVVSGSGTTKASSSSATGSGSSATGATGASSSSSSSSSAFAVLSDLSTMHLVAPLSKSRFAGLQAAEDDRGAVAGQARDHAPAQLLSALLDGHGVGGDSRRGNVDALGLLDDDFGGGAHSGLQARLHLVELEGHVVADGPAVAGREDGDFADVGCHLASFERFDGHGCDLADLHVADFRKRS